jgi:hypothetical protein
MQTLSALQIWKRNRMTMLVGMIGSDGILLGADARRVAFAAKETELDDVMGSRKITPSSKHKLAYAVAGDRLTYGIAEAVVTKIDIGAFYFQDIEKSLQSVATDTLKAIEGSHPERITAEHRCILIAFYGSQVEERQLWSLKIGCPSIARRVTGMALGGGLSNTARFFYQYFESNKPLASLMLLAAHLILMAARVDSLMVNGLDIFLIEDSGCHFIDEVEKSALRERSTVLHTLIGEQLFRGMP